MTFRGSVKCVQGRDAMASEDVEAEPGAGAVAVIVLHRKIFCVKFFTDSVTVVRGKA